MPDGAPNLSPQKQAELAAVEARPPACDPLDVLMMERALAAADRAAELGEVPIAAVVYRGEQVLAEAFNLRESHADPTAHAEILALRQAAAKLGSWRLDGCSLAVTLEPCPMCAGALVNARVSRLVYGPPDPKMGCVDTLHQLCSDERFNHQLTVVRGVLAEQCVARLQAFFRLRRGEQKPAKPRPAPPPEGR